MGDRTTIAWTDATWNPVTGCSHVSPGCEHCYAELLSHRFGWTQKPWGAQHAAENVVLHPARLDEPLHWRRLRRVFVCSMADLFHEQVPDQFIGLVWQIMSELPRHTFQVLTKRPRRMLDWHSRFFWMHEPLPNVWLGVSCEDQQRADERIPLLLQTPAAVRFVSLEPLLGPISLIPLRSPFHRSPRDAGWEVYPLTGTMAIPDYDVDCAKLDWVIVGGESGPSHRAMDLDWARSLRDQCVASGVAFFYKQGAGSRPGCDPFLDGRRWEQFPGPAVGREVSRGA